MRLEAVMSDGIVSLYVPKGEEVKQIDLVYDDGLNTYCTLYLDTDEDEALEAWTL